MPGERSNSLEAGNQFGHYTIRKLLGRGGMGEVYLADDLQLNREVALKLLSAALHQNPIARERFQREARSAAALHHNNICTIYEVGEENGRNYIAMEYCEGKSLLEQIQGKPLEIDEIVNIAIQIADVLDVAQKKNIVHRDLKPGNIILSKKNEVKVLDFGLAKTFQSADVEIANASTDAHLTDSGVVIGTVAYMSPEQALGKKVDHRSDLFSFGIILYEMLTGRLPFQGNSPTEILDAILHKEIPSLKRFNEKIPDSLILAVNKMLTKDVEDRYQSAHEIRSDLRRIKTGPASEANSLPRKSNYKAWIIAGSLLALGLMSGYLLQRSQRPSPGVQTSSILALPCKVYGGKDQEYLTDAIPSTLSSHLATFQGLDTKLPPTSIEIQKLNSNIKEIADAYHAETVLLSTITAEPERLVLNVQLVEPATRNVRWSHDYQGDRQHYLDLASSAAIGIRDYLKLRESPASPAGISRVADAELAYHEGKYFSDRYNNRHEKADFDKAVASFQNALTLDPKLANAAGEIGKLYSFQAEATGSPNVAEMEKWAKKAIEIDPQSASGWTLIGYREAEWNPNPNFERLFDAGLKAARFGRNDSQAQFLLPWSISTYSLKLSDPGIQYVHNLDPFYLYSTFNLATNNLAYGRAPETLARSIEALRIEPEMDYGMWTKAIALIELNQPELAEGLTKTLFQRKGVLDTMLLILRYRLGAARKTPSEEDLQKIIHNVNSPTANGLECYFSSIALAPYLIRQGRKEEAIQILENTARVKALPYDLLFLNPEIAKLTGPRIEKIRVSTRVNFDQMIAILQRAQSRGELPEYLIHPLADLMKQTWAR